MQMFYISENIFNLFNPSSRATHSVEVKRKLNVICDDAYCKRRQLVFNHLSGAGARRGHVWFLVCIVLYIDVIVIICLIYCVIQCVRLYMPVRLCISASAHGPERNYLHKLHDCVCGGHCLWCGHCLPVCLYVCLSVCLFV